MDFLEISTKFNAKANVFEIFPSFIVKKSRDLLVKGHHFYAVWDDENQIWSTDIYRLVELIDEELYEYYQICTAQGKQASVKYVRYATNGSWYQLNEYLSSLDDTDISLDSKLTFLHDDVGREDYRSKRLDYDIQEGDHSAWDELVGTLYTNLERRKIEWAIGSVLDGASTRIQKFVVFYGEAGTGKSTVLHIIEDLFKGYVKTFEARELGRLNSSFSTAAFASNPLVAIQHDGDLSRIEDNTRLNSIIAHESIIINEKYKSPYTSTIQSFLFMGTNKPVKITDAKSGIIRRLIDVHPSGQKVAPSRYYELMNAIKFQLGAIAFHCKNVYEELGEYYYDRYKPIDMMYRTDTFFNFVEEHYFDFKDAEYCTLKQAWDMYKKYCEDAKIGYSMPLNAFREELKSYFQTFSEMTRVDGKMTRSVYKGFLASKFDRQKEQDFRTDDMLPMTLVLDKTESIFDKVCKDCLAQYANENETPLKKWDDVTTKLSDISTNKLHYVQLPENHIVIDFDLKDEEGKKDAQRNLDAAAKWPETYAEFSKGGAGIHLHYIYDGDAAQLSRIFDTGIEIKVFTGKSALRRKLTLCNGKKIAHISSGLPLKEIKKMVDFDVIWNEQQIRGFIEKNLRKEIHPGTKPSIDFIYMKLNEQYEKGAHYDVRDLRQKVLTFAMHSSHHASYCTRLVNKMKFCSDDISEPVPSPEEQPIVFFDIEVYPNLFVVCWKYQGEGKKVVQMINPTAQDMEKLMQMKLVGFNNRRYDNHLIYARYLGYTNEEMYKYSQKIINAPKGSDVFMREAYNISYTDVYDLAAAPNKKSLKKYEIELDIHHQEMSIPWDQPVPEELWQTVADYCSNDVIATEAVFNHLDGDLKARLMLSKIAKSIPNSTTNQLSLGYVFENNKEPGLVYTDLSTGKQYGPGQAGPYTNKDERGRIPDIHNVTEYKSKTNAINCFPGYEYKDGKNMFRGEDVGRGGYVYAQPGIYYHVVCFDVSGMHPASIRAMECFGDYTSRFGEIIDARLAVKHKDYESAKKMLNGDLAQYLNDIKDAKDISLALKTAANSLYGLTSAKFKNPARDERNVNNIVALRGALFMVTLRDELLAKEQTVIHIKTDSIKVVNPSPDISQFIMDFGKKYGYTFEIEHKFERICLINDAVYIAKLESDDPEAPDQWTATGAQFAQPYVFKTLFSKEPVVFKDMAETKSVSGNAALYLDRNENLPEGEHDYNFIGRVGSFVPVVDGVNGGLLLRGENGKYSQATGTTGYRWLESEYVKTMHLEDKVDISYHRHLVDDALEAIAQFGDPDEFINADIYPTAGQS